MRAVVPEEGVLYRCRALDALPKFKLLNPASEAIRSVKLNPPADADADAAEADVADAWEAEVMAPGPHAPGLTKASSSSSSLDDVSSSLGTSRNPTTMRE